MVDHTNNPPHDDGLPGEAELPAALRQELRRHFGRPGNIAPAGELAKLDARVMAEARTQFAARQEQPAVIATIGRSYGWRIGAAAAALAACAALVLTLPSLFSDARPEHAAPMAVNPRQRGSMSGDVNGDGKVDILDAYTLQRMINGPTVADAQWDLNGDGTVDQRDVHSVASFAVKLSGGPRL